MYGHLDIGGDWAFGLAQIPVLPGLYEGRFVRTFEELICASFGITHRHT